MTAVTEGQPCIEFPTSKEAISYEPFYGHYATTGLAKAAQAAREAAPSPEQQAKKPPKGHAEPSEPRSGRAPGASAPTPPAKQPTAPPAQHVAEEPVDKQTGGAGPG